MVTQTHFSDIFATLFKFREEGFLCDTVIMSSDKELQAHGLLLAAVSPVFKSAFTDNTKRGRYLINLSGVDSSVIEIALHFIYTGKLLLPHVYTQTNELPKLFAALHVLGLEPQKLNGCEMRFKSPEDSATIQKTPKLGETPITIKLYNEPRVFDATTLDTLKNNTEKVEQVESTTKQTELNEPDDSEAAPEEPLQQSTSPVSDGISPPVSEAMEEVLVQEESVKAEEDTPQIRRQRRGRPPRNKNFAYSVQNDLRAKTRQSRRFQAMIRKKDKISPQSKMKQSFNPDDTKQMISLLTGLRFDQVKFEKTSPEKLAASVVDGEEGLQASVVKEEVVGEMVLNESQSDSSPAKSMYIVLIPAKKSPESVNHLPEIVVPRNKSTKKHACYICTKPCKTRSRLEQHLLTHTGEKPHVCVYCSKGFTNKSNLDRHVKMHTGVRPHLCDLCGKGFIQKTSLLDHMIIHTEAKAYKCTVCGLSYNRKTNLRQHFKRRHQSKPGQLAEQDGASGFDAKRPFLCDLCGRGFATVVTLKFHKKLHAGDKPFICSVCDKGFVQKAQLDQHFRIHTGEKPYVCQVCGKAFVYKDSLTQHTRIHTGEKPYVCQICSKAYTQSHHLKGHMLTHTGEKPFACQLCSKAYKNRADLRFHSARIHQVNIPKTTRSAF